MMEITFSYPSMEFQVNEYNKTIKRHLEVTMRQVARVFVREAILWVPIDTGMARGSFLNLSRLIRNLSLGLRGAGGKRIGRSGATYYGRDGKPLPKTPESGASLSTPQEEIFTVQGSTYYFNYGTSVWHYNINDFFGGHAPTAPWFSYEKGQKAAIEWLRVNSTKRFPDFREFIIVTNVTIDGRGRSEKKFRLKEKSTELEDF